MAAPIRVATASGEEAAADHGPKLIGSAWYVLAEVANGDRFQMYKSTDDGATWAIIAGTVGAAVEYFYDTVWTATTCTVCYMAAGTGGTRYFLRTFDTATDTWGSVSAEGPRATGDFGATDIDGASMYMVRMVRVSSGNIYIFYPSWPAGNQFIRFAIYNGSTWSSTDQTLINAGGTNFYYLIGAAVGQDDVMHVYYRLGVTGVYSGIRYYISLTSSTPGTPVQISAVASGEKVGKTSVFDTEDILYLPDYSSNEVAGVWVGTPISAPVWSFQTIGNNNLGAGVHDIGELWGANDPEYGAASFSFVAGDVAYLIWASTDETSSTAPTLINRIYYARNSGAGWSERILVYDNVQDPATWLGIPVNSISMLSGAVYEDQIAICACINTGGVAFFGLQDLPEEPGGVGGNGEVATVHCSILINPIEPPPEPHPCPVPEIESDQLPSFEGTAISIANELYLRNALAGDFGLVPPELMLKRQVDRFAKSGTNPTFTLSLTPNDDYPVAVYFDGILQFPTGDYTISGLTYTMVGTFSLTSVRVEYYVGADA